MIPYQDDNYVNFEYPYKVLIWLEHVMFWSFHIWDSYEIWLLLIFIVLI